MDHSILAAQSRGLSGEDILSVCVNAFHARSSDPDPNRRLATQAMIAMAQKAHKWIEFCAKLTQAPQPG